MECPEYPPPRVRAGAGGPAGLCVESFRSLSSSERMSTFERTRTCLTEDSTDSGRGVGAWVSPKLISGTGSGVFPESRMGGGAAAAGTGGGICGFAGSSLGENLSRRAIVADGEEEGERAPAGGGGAGGGGGGALFGIAAAGAAGAGAAAGRPAAAAVLFAGALWVRLRVGLGASQEPTR